MLMLMLVLLVMVMMSLQRLMLVFMLKVVALWQADALDSRPMLLEPVPVPIVQMQETMVSDVAGFDLKDRGT